MNKGAIMLNLVTFALQHHKYDITLRESSEKFESAVFLKRP